MIYLCWNRLYTCILKAGFFVLCTPFRLQLMLIIPYLSPICLGHTFLNTSWYLGPVVVPYSQSDRSSSGRILFIYLCECVRWKLWVLSSFCLHYRVGDKQYCYCQSLAMYCFHPHCICCQRHCSNKFGVASERSKGICILSHNELPSLDKMQLLQSWWWVLPTGFGLCKLVLVLDCVNWFWDV